jgi:hypothetical protein
MQQLVGKSVDALVLELGQPNATSAANNGAKMYEYVVAAPQLNRNETLIARTYEFDIGADGVVSAARG